MANSELIDSLQMRKSKQETGLLTVRRTKTPEKGSINMAEGDIVYARTNSDIESLAAVYLMLAWSDAVVGWAPGVFPQKVICSHEPDKTILEYMQLEDSCGSADAIIQEIMQASDRRRLKRLNNTLKLTSLKKARVRLEGAEPNGHPVHFELEVGNYLVGKEMDCDLVLSSVKVSRHHCRIYVTETSVTITDLGSMNGTYVNDEMIQRMVVNPGDTVAFGDVALTLSAEDRKKQSAILFDPSRQKKEILAPTPTVVEKPETPSSFWTTLLEK